MEDLNPHVRTGTPEDIDGIMKLAKMAVEENGLVVPNYDKILEEIWSGLTRQFGIMGVIGSDRDNPEGFILLRVEPLWYSDDVSLVERVVFVHPDFRSAKGGRARKLCEFAKKVSEELHMPLIIGILSTQRSMSKVKLYKRQFGEPTGAYWILNGETGAWKDTPH